MAIKLENVRGTGRAVFYYNSENTWASKRFAELSGTTK